MNRIRTASLLLLVPLVLNAQEWSLSFAAGPFLFGDFAESTTRIRTFAGDDDDRITHSLTADTRAGAIAALERSFNDRLSVRLEGSYTDSPLAVRSGGGGDAVSLDIAGMTVTTLSIPFVFRFNRGGRLRPLLYAGPAWATYDIEPALLSETVPLFSGSRGRVGGIAGGGVEWWWNDRIGLRASVSDIVTDSPLERTDFPGPSPNSLEIKTAHNVHTAVGISYRF